MLEIHIDEKGFAAGSPPVLQDLQISAEKGAFTCLVGPSGCGKSTLLNIIGGLDQHYQGRVSLDGAPPRDVGYVFQNPRLMPWLSVLENVRLVLSPEDYPRAEALLIRMGLGERLHHYPNRLSGGMQRRVALARAFAVRPSLLLLDEPFVSLDLPVATRLRALLLELWADYAPTVLFVTHDLPEALALGDRVIFLATSPARVVLDLPVPLARPRQRDDTPVHELATRLLQEHPSLLEGHSLEVEDV